MVHSNTSRGRHFSEISDPPSLAVTREPGDPRNGLLTKDRRCDGPRDYGVALPKAQPTFAVLNGFLDFATEGALVGMDASIQNRALRQLADFRSAPR